METIAIRKAGQVTREKMKNTGRQQMVVRLPESLMARIKYQALKAQMSVNAYVEAVMEDATKAKIPQLPKNYKVDISGFPEKVKLKMPSQEELVSDPKLAYLWGKLNMEERLNED